MANKLGAFILNEPEAHTNFNLTPKQELEILTKYMKIIKKINIFFLTDVYVLNFSYLSLFFIKLIKY